MVDKKHSFPDKMTWDFVDADGYADWRQEKLAQQAVFNEQNQILEIQDIAQLSAEEHDEIFHRCEISNAVLYRDLGRNSAEHGVSERLRQFAKTLGLEIAEKHRSAEKDGIVSLQESESAGKKGYIPYSKRPMNWHTDGYYNGPDQKIRAMLLHCVRSADSGGSNQILDPEIAYLRLRDTNPDYIKALMHPEAMTIPENKEADGSLRPVSIGPVFSVDPQTGKLEMRYTARTRSISWRDDPLTSEAVACLTQILAAQDPFIQTVKLQAGDGILCNNSLHNRTGFDADNTQPSDRLMMRVRFHNRVKGR